MYACINIAIRRLPFVLLKTHVMTTATIIAKRQTCLYA
jgi:hypothetical protein